MSVPVRFPNGLTNRGSNHPLGDLILPDPTSTHRAFNDFTHPVEVSTSLMWAFTTASGANTFTQADADGGVAVLTNATSAAAGAAYVQDTKETFKFEAGKKLFFSSRWKVGKTNTAHIMGLQIRDVTPLDVSDGVFFEKSSASAGLNFRVEKDGTASSASNVHTMVADTWVTTSFVYDGVDEIKYYIDNVHKGTLAVTNLPDDEELARSWGQKNDAGTTATMYCDFILAEKMR